MALGGVSVGTAWAGKHGAGTSLSGATFAAALALGMLGLGTASGLAQQRSEPAKVQQQQIQPSVEGSGRASGAAGGGLGAITFDDVLASPDDAAVNLAYAQEMIRTGRFDIAAATLERILILHPELDRVRLLYAVVLYRLDNLDEARAEFELLRKRDLSRREAAEVARYVETIDKRQQRHKTSLTVSTGLHFDSNRNVFPKDGVFKVLDVPVSGIGERRSDLGLLAIGTLDYRYDTHLQRAREVFVSGSVFVDRQDDQRQLDTFAILLDTGFVYDTGSTQIIPKLHLDKIVLDTDSYADDVAGILRLQRRLFSPSFLAFAELEGGYNYYHNSDAYPFASEQEGPYYALKVGGSYAFSRQFQLEAFYRYRNKDADLDYEAYDSHLVSGRLTYVLPRNIFMLLDASLELQDYDGADPFISSRVREDTDWMVGLTYGFPLSALGWSQAELDPLPEPLRDVIFSISGSYARSNSNIPNFDYENWRAQALFTKRVDF